MAPGKRATGRGPRGRSHTRPAQGLPGASVRGSACLLHSGAARWNHTVTHSGMCCSQSDCVFYSTGGGGRAAARLGPWAAAALLFPRSARVCAENASSKRLLSGSTRPERRPGHADTDPWTPRCHTSQALSRAPLALLQPPGPCRGHWGLF